MDYQIKQNLYLTKTELAAQLQISIRQLEKLVDAKKIPVTRLGKRCVRFDPDSVKQALSLLEIKAVRRNTPPPHSNKKSNAID
jgi:excisionase family DNA binding protein